MTQNTNGAILYRGPSLLDGAPIVVIATGLKTRSSNTKTGAMVQTWILREDVSPIDAIKSGDDCSICGNCPHRGDSEGRGRSCYVRVFQAPLSVWRAYHRGVYPDWSERVDWPELSRRVVRLGSYGDPAAAPLSVWKRYVRHASRWTGYTHQWSDAPWLRDYCMASVDSETEARVASRDYGWRYFRVGPAGATPAVGEVLCPASEEGGRKTTCENCTLCKGRTSKARKSVMIPAHGSGKRYVELRAA